MRAWYTRGVRLFTALAFVVAVVVTPLGCGKHLYNQDDLTVALFKHHTDLRWGRLENAALLVEPQLRGAFLAMWASKANALELQDVDIAGVSMSPDGDGADVVINVTYVERETMQVKNAVLNEHWTRTDDGWFADKPATLDG